MTLREFRRTRKLSQERVAKELGISYRKLHRPKKDEIKKPRAAGQGRNYLLCRSAIAWLAGKIVKVSAALVCTISRTSSALVLRRVNSQAARRS